jgi:hypothetical protein
MNNFLLCIAIMCVVWGVVSTIAMVSFCSDKGIKINWLLIRLLIFKYVNQYREITVKENGKPGRWYYSFIISMSLALGFAIIGLIFKNS